MRAIRLSNIGLSQKRNNIRKLYKGRQWNVFAEIPVWVVCGPNACIGNGQWRFSFGRYDYTRGAAEPCISSTSPHAEPDFHRRHEWGVLTFKMLS